LRSIPEGLKADLIVSQNSFEHFLHAESVLTHMHTALAPGGKIFITFGPPWFAPWGAHMAFFCRLPWVQVLFLEQTVMEVRQLFKPDGGRSYQEVGLAQMSVDKFERTIQASGLRCIARRYECIRGMHWLQFTPFRELFINRISCLLA